MSNLSLSPLRSDLQFTVHQGPEELWYAVHEPNTGRFIRLGQREYRIASLLEASRTPQSITEEINSSDSDGKTTEADVLNVQTKLMQLGLTELPQSTPQRTPAPTTLNPMMIRIPLLSGKSLDRVAHALIPWLGWQISLLVAGLWVIAVACVVANYELFSERTQKLFVSDQRIWLVVSWLLLKSIHELGHAFFAVRAGSQVRSAGISLIYFAPVPYVDVSDLWTISNRWKRIACSSGGILFEMSVAALAAVVAVSTSNLTLQYFCVSLATLGTFTTLAFNANPLARFDGYFVVSDLLNRPNLWTEGTKAFHACARKAFLWKATENAAFSLNTLLYGIACFIYRIVMLFTMAVWAVLVWQGIGIGLVIWGGYAMFIAPLVKKLLSASSKSQQDVAPAAPSARRIPAMLWHAVPLVVALLILALVASLPSPITPRAPGVVTYRNPVMLRSEADGFLVEVLVAPGSSVQAGELIARLSNDQLEQEYRIKEIEVAECSEKVRGLLARTELAKSQAEESKLASLQSQLEQLRGKLERLDIRAPSAGEVTECSLGREIGKYFTAGSVMATIADTRELQLTVSASQSEVEVIQKSLGSSTTVLLEDRRSLQGTIDKVELRGVDELQEPSLAAIYGGPIAVELESDPEQGDRLRLREPRFEVTIRIDESKDRAIPGELGSVAIPGQTTRLWNVAFRWLENKWQSLVDASSQS